MWGNSRGWLISLVIALLAGALVYAVATGSRPTPPTAFSDDARHFAPLVLPAPPPGALPEPREPGDAGPLVRQAIEQCRAQPSLYQNFARLGKLDSPQAAELEAVALLVRAARRGQMDLFAGRPREVIHYGSMKPDLEALQVLGQVCVDRLGLLHQRAGDHDQALEHYRAGFALGLHLCRERVTYAEFEVGMELLGKSAQAMAGLFEQTGKPDVAAALRDFDAKRLEIQRERIDPVLRVVRTIDAKVVGAQTGDVIELARRGQERMWRVEAILALGRVRHFAGAGGTAGNQRAAMALVTQLAEKDSDPVIRTAAAAARDLTVQQHWMQ